MLLIETGVMIAMKLSKKRNNKLRRRAMEFTNSDIPLLDDGNDKHSSSLSLKETNQLSENQLGPKQFPCISSTVDSLIDLDNVSIIRRDEMVEEGKDISESQHPFNDGVKQSSDLTLSEIP